MTNNGRDIASSLPCEGRQGKGLGRPARLGHGRQRQCEELDLCLVPIKFALIPHHARLDGLTDGPVDPRATAGHARAPPSSLLFPQ